MAKDDLVLVRVQDDLHGAFMGEGGLTLPYKRDQYDRNTLHFTLNCIVQDHAYGKFNLDDEGNLKAKIVLITDPKDMPTPAGLGQVDTWYRLDAEKNLETGKIDRSLALGPATIVAPAGTSIPQGANVIFYDGGKGIDARDAAVEQYFEARQIPMETASMRGWQSNSEREAVAWAKDAAQTLYGENAKHVHTDTHDSSIDASLESRGTSGLIQSLEKQRFSNDDGIDVPYLSRIEDKSTASVATLERFLQDLPPDEHRRISAHYEGQIEAIQANLVRARELDAGWVDAQEKQYKAQITQELQALPGKGDFLLMGKDGSGHEALDAKGLAERIAEDKVSLSQNIWREGMSSGWSPVRNTPVSGIVDPRLTGSMQSSLPPEFDEPPYAAQLSGPPPPLPDLDEPDYAAQWSGPPPPLPDLDEPDYAAQWSGPPPMPDGITPTPL